MNVMLTSLLIVLTSLLLPHTTRTSLDTQSAYFQGPRSAASFPLRKAPLELTRVSLFFSVTEGKGSKSLPEGQDVHVNWTGRGGNISASTYNA